MEPEAAVTSGATTGSKQSEQDSAGQDYSNLPSAPTPIGIEDNGTILISGTVTGKIGGGGPDDIDYVTFTIPEGAKLSSFELKDYQSVDKIAFIALQAGPQITGSAKDPKPFLGYTHFGTGASQGKIGDNLLTKLNQAKPLTAGTYSLWIQQGGPIPIGANAARATTSYRFKLKTEKKNEPTTSDETMVSDQTAELPNNRTDLILSGAKRINGTGNHKNNRITGNDSDNILDGREGADVLTGKGGKDQFSYVRLKNSTFNSHDRITDFVIGVDQIKGPRPVPASAVIELESIASLNAQSISNLLTSKLFRPHQAASFSFDSDAGKRVFLAINNDLAGYQANQDCLIEITGFTGRLGDLSIS